MEHYIQSSQRIGSHSKELDAFSKVTLSILIDRKEVMVKCLLDTGCTTSMILKKFIDQKQRIKLSDKDSIKYQTYGSSFTSSMTASVGFKMVEFESQKNNTIEYEFQVDKTLDPDKQLYDVIIRSNLLQNMRVNILFKERQIHWNDKKIHCRLLVPYTINICVQCFTVWIPIVLFYKK